MARLGSGAKPPVSPAPYEGFEANFPRLDAEGYRVFGGHADAGDYNCFAWAAGRSAEWWEPFGEDETFWPPGAPRDLTIEAFIVAYATLGFKPCDDRSVEVGFEKLVFYRNAAGEPTHAARQTSSGTWTSKLGKGELIEHSSPESLEGPAYGAAACFLKRVVPPTSDRP